MQLCIYFFQYFIIILKNLYCTIMFGYYRSSHILLLIMHYCKFATFFTIVLLININTGAEMGVKIKYYHN